MIKPKDTTMLLSINTWWSSLDTLQQIYWAFALPFSAVFIIQMIMTLIGAGGDGDIDTTGDVDLDVDADAGIGFQFITLKNFIAFFTIFGWTGVACLDAGFGICILGCSCAGYSKLEFGPGNYRDWNLPT